MNIVRAYGRLLEEKPLRTKCITSFVTFGLGDLLCQYFEKKYSGRKEYDCRRTFRQATFGFIFTPAFHLHFTIIMPWLFPASSKYGVIKSVIYDQTVFASFFTNCFFLYVDLMAGKTFKEHREEMKMKFWPTMYANWTVWPFIMFVNFNFVPLHWRVLFANIAGMFWNCYLSYVQNVKIKTQIAPEKKH